MSDGGEDDGEVREGVEYAGRITSARRADRLRAHYTAFFSFWNGGSGTRRN